MRLPSIRADLRSIQVNAPRFSQIQLISGHLHMGAFPNFYRNSFGILWTRRIQFWCPLRLRWLRSNGFMESPGRVRKSYQPNIFSQSDFCINYTGRIFREYMYHIIRLHFLVDWDFFAKSYLHLHCLHCRACSSWTPRARPQHRPLQTAGTHRRDTCPLFPFPMPALSPPARLRGAFSKGIA